MKFLIIIIIFLSTQVFARELGQTEITTDEGIEVFKQEKYYLLKKNVEIISDEFKLNADLVKAFFNEGLYDVIRIDSTGNVILKSKRGIKAMGERVDFNVKDEDIKIYGNKSLLITNEMEMKSDGFIKVNNMSGLFSLEGENNTLKNQDVYISGYFINGSFIKFEEINEIENLFVEDQIEINIKTETLDMYSLKAKYNKKNNIIELFENVKIIRDNESIEGDYAIINTLTESYKVTSTNANKVKVLLKEKEEDE